MDLIKKIESRKAKVAVIGMGYVGFPLAVEFAKAGFTVYGIDVNETNDAGRVMGGFCTGTGTRLNLDITAKNAAADGQWHHVAIVYDGALAGANRSTLYLDGNPQGAYAAWTNDASTAFRSATLYIGSRNNSSLKYTGELDDIRITGAALAPSAFLKRRSAPSKGTVVQIHGSAP